MDEVRGHWLVTGRVQGVGFRWFVLQAARRHHLRGDVCNLPDGRDEVRAIGHAPEVVALTGDLEEGPPGARVDSVEQLQLDPSLHFERFEIRH